MPTNPYTSVDGTTPVAANFNTHRDAILELQALLAPNWTAITMSSGWTPSASGNPGLCYRKFGGMIQIDGTGFYTGTIGTTGVQVGFAAPIAAALTANMSNYTDMPIGSNQFAVGQMHMKAYVDGRLFVYSNVTVTNPLVNFGCQFRDTSVA